MAPIPPMEKDLVAEQPGLGLSFMGLFLAFFIGLAIRASVSPDRVQVHLYEATQNIHKDLSIQFESAHVSFARGFWPDLAVVIENVKIESVNPCWFTPLAEINEIRLPLSLKHLFQGKILIHQVLADEVNLSLKTPFRQCPAQEGSASLVEPPSSRSAASVEPTNSSQIPGPSQRAPVMGKFENVPRENPIDTVLISKLKIHYLPLAFTSFEIENFKAQLLDQDPRWIQLIGRLHLEGESSAREYGAYADLQVDLREGESPSIETAIKGLWREGQYDLKAFLDQKTQNLTFEADLRHLPLSRIIPILKKYRYVESEFNGKRAWISGHMKAEGPVSNIAKSPLFISNVKMEGDLGEISSQQIEIQSFQPLRFKPIEFQIRGLNINELLVFLNRPHPSPALGHLGLFNGTANFTTPEQVHLRGDYSGLEFIFSNRGSRQIQTLSLVSGELELKKDQWNIQIDRVRPVEGIFEGKVKILADKSFKSMQIDALITELGLSPRIQTLMTGGGSLGALSGQLKAQLQSAQISELRGNLKWDQLFVEGVKFQRPKAQIQSLNHEIQMKLSAAQMEIFPQSAVAPIFQPLMGVSAENAFKLTAPTTTIRTQKFQSLSWNQFQAQTASGALRSSGKWNEKAELSGEIQISEGSKKKFWEIHGTRNQPLLVEQN
ncbi:MAG: hypothetical protein ACAH59_08335 [Pseudobdellovibrionaceae bacterium]